MATAKLSINPAQKEYQDALNNFDDCVLLLRLNPQESQNHFNLTMATARLVKADEAIIG